MLRIIPSYRARAWGSSTEAPSTIVCLSTDAPDAIVAATHSAIHVQVVFFRMIGSFLAIAESEELESQRLSISM